MSKRVEVVFMKDLENVARTGEKKLVAGGFWRNFLLPKRLAVPAATGVARKLVSDREKTLEKEKAAVQAVAVVPSAPAKKTVRQAKKQEKKVKETKKSARLKQRVKKK